MESCSLDQERDLYQFTHIPAEHCDAKISVVTGPICYCLEQLAKYEVFENDEIDPFCLRQQLEFTHVDNASSHICSFLVQRLTSDTMFDWGRNIPPK